MNKIFALIFVLFAGCTTTPALDKTADYGPTPTNAQAVIQSYFAQILKDPESVRYTGWTEPTKGYVRGPMYKGYPLTYGWLVGVNVNAKNSYGGYTGFKKYTFLMRGDLIAEQIAPLE